MLELNKTYKLGKKTFWLFFIKYAKWMVLATILQFWFIWECWFGRLAVWSDNYLANALGPNIPLDKSAPTLWIAISAVSFTFVGFLSAHVMYRQYKFLLDETALHVRYGIFNIKQIVLPYQQIQNVEIKQPLLHRILGLASIEIMIPNYSRGEEKIATKNLLPVIDKKVATLIVSEIIKRGARNSGIGQLQTYESEKREDKKKSRRRH